MPRVPVVVVDRLGRPNVYSWGGHWSTGTMRSGEETVEEHLIKRHKFLPELVAELSFAECHIAHDKIHVLNGDAAKQLARVR